ncbi:MAG: helix-turn-helix domain-containing protein [Paludibacteraceae bacterium]|nr:helix-turn-helix domain-containing protein [Paludibacteraceae bacterium]
MKVELGIIKEILKGCDKDCMVSDSTNHFYGLWRVRHLSVMSRAERLPIFFYGFIISGEIEIEVDLKPYTFCSGNILRLRPGQVMQVRNVSDDFCCSLFFFDKRVVGEIIAGIQVPLVSTSPLLTTSEALRKSLSVYLSIMFEKLELMKNDNSPYLGKIVEQVVKAMLCEIFHEISKGRQDKPIQTNRAQDIFVKFSSLVDENYAQHRDVAWYADRLNLSHKYLCKVMSESIGTSPGQFIDQKVSAEAKHMLANTSMTVQQIAQELSFPNQSLFARYFKRNTSLSPMEFRNMRVEASQTEL